MKPCSLACLICLLAAFATFATAQASLTKTIGGWVLDNGNVRLELVRARDSVRLKSLRDQSGPEWAAAGSPLITSPDNSGNSYRFADDATSDLEKGGKQLVLRFKSDSGAQLNLQLRLYPTGAVIQTVVQVEKQGTHALRLGAYIDALTLTLKNVDRPLKVYSTKKGKQGFYAADPSQHEFPDWLVLENIAAGESMLIGGEPGLGCLDGRLPFRLLPTELRSMPGQH